MTNEFRTLNENERKAVGSALMKTRIPETHPLVVGIDLLEVSYEKMQGGFCVCIIRSTFWVGDPPKKHYSVFRGASRRSYKDPRNDIRGEMLAFSRALLYSRPVELL